MSGQAQFEVYPQMHPAAADPEVPENVLPGQPTGEFGWRFRAANGQIVATSGEGFTRREDAKRAVTEFLDAALRDPCLQVPIVDIPDIETGPTPEDV